MKTKYISILILILSTFSSCNDEYLDKKSNKSLVVPTTLKDFQALLDNAQDVINIVPGLGIVSSDEGFTTYSAWQGLYTAAERNAYIWATNIYEGENSDDWNKPYQQIFYANVVLDGIEKIEKSTSNEDQWNISKEVHYLCEHMPCCNWPNSLRNPTMKPLLLLLPEFQFD